VSNTVRILRSTTAGNVPSSLVSGQIAVNEADGRLFFRSPSGTVTTFSSIASFATTASFPAVGLANVLYLASDSSRAYQFVGGVYIEVGVSGGGGTATTSASDLTSGTLPDARLSSNVTVNQNLRWAMQTTSTSIDWLPRGHGTIGNAAAFSGSLMLAFFTAPYSFTATTLTFITGGTATASLSLCRFALFTVNETIVDSVTGTSPIITMVARTANDTTIGNASQTIYSRAFATDGYPASYSIVAGTRYAAGVLVVGSTAGTWQAGTVTTGAITRLPPMAAGAVTGLSDMPTAPTTVSNGNFMIYGRIS
jgi:hypothetical protein